MAHQRCVRAARTRARPSRVALTHGLGARPCVPSGIGRRCLKIASRACVPFRAQVRPFLMRPCRAHPWQSVLRLVEAWVATTGVACGCPPAPPPAKRSRGRPRRHIDGCRTCWRSLAADRDLPPPHDLSPSLRACLHDLRLEHPSSGRMSGLDPAAVVQALHVEGGAPCDGLRGHEVGCRRSLGSATAEPPRRQSPRQRAVVS